MKNAVETERVRLKFFGSKLSYFLLCIAFAMPAIWVMDYRATFADTDFLERGFCFAAISLLFLGYWWSFRRAM